MTSAIDVTVPIYGNPTTKSVRDNFAAAHDEIGALQTDVGTKVNRSGDTMTGFLSLYLDPELPTHAATKSYVDGMAITGGGGISQADGDARWVNTTGDVMTGGLTINMGVVTPPVSPDARGSLFLFPAGGAANCSHLVAYSFGPVSPGVSGVAAGGTADAPTALLLNYSLMNMQGFGRGTTAYSTARANFNFRAAENWTDTAQGTYWQLETTAIGTTTMVAKARLTGAGNLILDPLGAFTDTGENLQVAGTTRFKSGISFGAVAVTNPTDYSKHISLYDGFGGISITGNRVNIGAQGLLVFVQAGEDVAQFGNLGFEILRPNNTVTLNMDPTSPFHAATKQYVDNKVGSGGASLTVADTPPTIANGKMWFDSNKTQLYVGYDDGTSSQWVIANNPNVLTTGAINTALQPTYNNVGRNLINNSMFNIQQRGGGPFTTRSLFTADRWQMDFIGGTLSVSLPYLTDANRVSIGDEFARYQMVLNFAGGSAASDETYLQQSIEGVTRTAGKIVTVSFWAAATSGTPKFGVALYQIFGTGGSPSPTIFVSGQSVTLSTTYTRYTMIFTIPSMSGKTVGTNRNDCLLFRFAVSAGSTSSPSYGNIGVQTGQIGIWGVQLEIGNTATPLEKPDPRIDFENCQRFYQIGFFDQCAYMIAGNSISYGFPFSVQMRTAPTVTTSNVVFNNATGLSVSPWNNSFLSIGAIATIASLTRVYGEFQASADL